MCRRFENSAGHVPLIFDRSVWKMGTPLTRARGNILIKFKICMSFYSGFTGQNWTDKRNGETDLKLHSVIRPYTIGHTIILIR